MVLPLCLEAPTITFNSIPTRLFRKKEFFLKKNEKDHSEEEEL